MFRTALQNIHAKGAGGAGLGEKTLVSEFDPLGHFSSSPSSQVPADPGSEARHLPDPSEQREVPGAQGLPQIHRLLIRRESRVFSRGSRPQKKRDMGRCHCCVDPGTETKPTPWFAHECFSLPQDVRQLLVLLSAVLHLGDVAFEPETGSGNNDAARVVDPDLIAKGEVPHTGRGHCLQKPDCELLCVLMGVQRSCLLFSQLVSPKLLQRIPRKPRRDYVLVFRGFRPVSRHVVPLCNSVGDALLSPCIFGTRHIVSLSPSMLR